MSLARIAALTRYCSDYIVVHNEGSALRMLNVHVDYGYYSNIEDG